MDDDQFKQLVITNLSSLTSSVGTLTGRVDLLDTKLEQGFSDIRQEMQTGLADVRQEMQTGLADVRQEMHAGFADVRQEMSDGFSAVNARIDAVDIKMDQGFAGIGDAIEEINDRLDSWRRQTKTKPLKRLRARPAS